MARNYYTPKTGYAEYDAYLKKQAIWMDSDLLQSFCVGMFIGTFLTVIVIFSLYL